MEQAVLRSVLRFCPVCDGFEATGKKIAVIGDGALGEREAQFLVETYSEHVSYLQIGECEAPRRTRLERLGISVREIALDQLRIDQGGLWLAQPRAQAVRYEVFYSALGCAPQHQLATALGAKVDENSALIVDSHQHTTVTGVYAAGDVARGLNQVVVAAAEAAIAATDVHNRLREGKRKRV